MTRKTSPKSARPNPEDAAESANSAPSMAKQLTVNVPTDILNRAKTLAALQGTTLSAVVAEALATYAEGLQGALVKLGLTK